MQRISTAIAAAMSAGSLFMAGAAIAQTPPPHGQPARGPPAHAQPPPPKPNSLGADWRLQQDEVRQGVRQRKLMPLGRAIASIRGRGPGRELDAGLEYQGGRAVYRVRWMTLNGRRVDYLIDAVTGAILSGG